MKEKFFCLLLVSQFIFCSCSGPLNNKYNPATFEQDIEEIRKDNTIPGTDMELLVKYILLSRLSGKDLQGETYKNILERLKLVHEKNLTLTEQQKGEEEIKRQRLSKFLNVILTEKGFTRIKNKDFLTYTLAFRNISPNNINTVIGYLRLNDLLDKEIKKVSILLDEVVVKGVTLKKTFLVEYNQTDQSDQRIRSKELVDMRFEWNPEKIIFKDGKIMD